MKRGVMLVTIGIDRCNHWIYGCWMFAGEYRGGGTSGNARSSAERGRISAYGDHPDSMDDPSSREDISEM